MLAPDDFWEKLDKAIAEEAPQKKTIAPRVCAHCRVADRRVMILMAPGRDGEAWYLCVRCWSDGVKSKREERDEQG